MSSISHDPPKVKLTYDDYVLIPNDGKRHEIINGRHYMNSAPNPRHQRISRLIQHQLITQIELPGFGEVYDAPVDLQLGDSDIVQPDLVIVLADNPIVTESRLIGVPDLVVEILSPSNPNHDKQLKMHLYEQSGIPEYWIVDPGQNAVSKYVLDLNEGRYRDAEIAKTEIQFQYGESVASVDLAIVW